MFQFDYYVLNGLVQPPTSLQIVDFPGLCWSIGGQCFFSPTPYDHESRSHPLQNGFPTPRSGVSRAILGLDRGAPKDVRRINVWYEYIISIYLQILFQQKKTAKCW